MIGRTLGGRYRLERALGRGGMATVWAARDLRLDRPVAVKLLEAQGAADEVAAKRFRREAHAVARLSHPNIVAVHDFDVDDGTPYLVMELLNGRSVDEMLTEGPLPVERAVTIAMQAARALAAAHAAGVVHRDIKPGNLLVDERTDDDGSIRDDAVKVLDFGIAQLQHVDQTALTRTAMAMGTSHYMAPETARGQRAGPKADLYGLGCTLYAMLTGTPPFNGKSAIAVLHKQVTEVPPRVRDSRPEVPAALDSLVAELLAKDPDERPANAGAVATRLLAIATGKIADTSVMPTAPVPTYGAASVPTAPAPTTPDTYPAAAAPESGAAVARRYALPMAAAIVVAVLVAAALVLWLGSPDTPRAGGAPVQSSAPPSNAAPSDPTPSAQPSTPAGRLALLRQLVRQQIDAGEVDSDAGKQLTKRLDDVGKALRKGKPSEATKHLSRFRSSLEEMRDDGKVSESGYDAILPALDSLAASLPADLEGDDHGDADGKRNDKGHHKPEKPGKHDD